MGLEEVVAEIIGQANSKRDIILKEGRDKAAEILKNAEKEIQQKESDAAADLENVKSTAEKKELADAELSCKKLLQDTRKELIAAAYDGMKAKISAMNDKERTKMLEKLFEKSAKQLDKVGTVYVSGSDLKLASALFKPKGIAVREKAMLGGLIAESSDGKILIDNSFDSIIDSMSERMIKDVSRSLF